MIQTHSKFYYNLTVGQTNYALDFSEGGAELKASIAVGSYTLTDLATQVALAMNAVGGQLYTVTVNRSTRVLTISAPGNFTLKSTTGSRVNLGCWVLIGFSGADKTGAATYSGSAIGNVYSTQFMLQGYTSSEDWRGSADATVNKAASGDVEVVSFGEERFIEFTLRYITDQALGSGAPIRSSATGVEDARTFMRYLITKGLLEFMPDENSPNTFEKIRLESTPSDQKGTSYRFKELYDVGLPGFYEIGPLKFRVDLS